MREIKFRAWDKSTKKMSEAEEVTHYFFQGGFLTGIYSDFIFMQYTGLKDKNNVEIYEGDICRQKYYTEDVVLIKWDESLISYKATVFSDGVECEDLFFIKSDSDKFEVIGNIYEHPELLK